MWRLMGVVFFLSFFFFFFLNLVPTPFLTLGNSLGGGDPLLAEGENVRAAKLFNHWCAERREKGGEEGPFRDAQVRGGDMVFQMSPLGTPPLHFLSGHCGGSGPRDAAEGLEEVRKLAADPRPLV